MSSDSSCKRLLKIDHQLESLTWNKWLFLIRVCRVCIKVIPSIPEPEKEILNKNMI